MNRPNSFSYRVVDVFSLQSLEGNPLAVFPDAGGLDDATMQKIAKELNLSETVFVFPSTHQDCVAAVRIFTPFREMPFAGHPTVGTAYVLLDEGKLPVDAKRFQLQEKIGPVPVRLEGQDPSLIWLTTPPIREGRTYDRALCARALGVQTADLLAIEPQVLSAGNPNLFVGLQSKEAVDRAWLDSGRLALLKEIHQESMCVFVFTPTAEGAYSRMFAPEHGIAEDPATGSATGPLALYMMKQGLAPSANGSRFLSEQGSKMGRKSILHIHIHGQYGSDGIEVGGYVAPFAKAVMTL